MYDFSKINKNTIFIPLYYILFNKYILGKPLLYLIDKIDLYVLRDTRTNCVVGDDSVAVTQTIFIYLYYYILFFFYNKIHRI